MCYCPFVQLGRILCMEAPKYDKSEMGMKNTVADTDIYFSLSL